MGCGRFIRCGASFSWRASSGSNSWAWPSGSKTRPCSWRHIGRWATPYFILVGWALADQGQVEEGIIQIRQGLATCQAIGIGIFHSYFLALLAEAYGKAGQAEEGLATLTEALEVVDNSGERFYEAELYRVKGQL